MQHSNLSHGEGSEKIRSLLTKDDKVLAGPLGVEREHLAYWLSLYDRVGGADLLEVEAIELLANISPTAEADGVLRALVMTHGWSATAVVPVWHALHVVLNHLHDYGRFMVGPGEPFDVLTLADTIVELEPVELGRVARAITRTLAATVGAEHRDRAALATAAVADLAAVVTAEDSVFLELRELGPELLEGEADDELFLRIQENLRRAREGVQ